MNKISTKSKHPYFGRTVVITTKHEKEKILKPILERHFQINVVLASGVDTDLLGTFSGDIARKGSTVETAVEKAKLGIQSTGIPIGIASEGSFGPNPQMPFFNSDLELLVLIDSERSITIEEYVTSPSTNVGEFKTKSMDEAREFLIRAKFGTHGMVVRPNSIHDTKFIEKGITTSIALERAVLQSARISSDGLAHIETDMRAHMNPTRQAVIAEAAEKFVARIGSLCSQCGCPGWGTVECIMGLPCEYCGGPTELIHKEIEGCPQCNFRKVLPRSDGKFKAPASYCQECNP